MQSTIVIHWDDYIDPEVARRIADEAFDAVADLVHGTEDAGDANVSATLWEDDSAS